MLFDGISWNDVVRKIALGEGKVNLAEVSHEVVDDDELRLRTALDR